MADNSKCFVWWGDKTCHSRKFVRLEIRTQERFEDAIYKFREELDTSAACGAK